MAFMNLSQLELYTPNAEYICAARAFAAKPFGRAGVLPPCLLLWAIDPLYAASWLQTSSPLQSL